LEIAARRLRQRLRHRPRQARHAAETIRPTLPTLRPRRPRHSAAALRPQQALALVLAGDLASDLPALK
jgi:hypothetical protein